MILLRLFHLLYAVALCGMVSGIFACGACVAASFLPPLRETVTTRSFLVMSLWGTVVLFVASLLPFYV